MSDEPTAKFINALSPGAKRALSILVETTSDQEMAWVGRYVGRAMLKAHEFVIDARNGAALPDGLPQEWIAALPEIRPLPGVYADKAAYEAEGIDVFLLWKQQELLARTGRVAECDPVLVADALEQTAAIDGPRRLHDNLRDIMFFLAWPHRTHHVLVHLSVALESFEDALASAPSIAGGINLDRLWQLVRLDIIGLGMPAPPEVCPWPNLVDALASGRAAREAFEE